MMTSTRRWSGWLVLGVSLLPGPARAQSVARSFEEPIYQAPVVADFSDLTALLSPGTTVIVTNTKGRKVKGQLTAVTRDSLSLATGGRTGARTFARPDVLEVQKQVPDSMLEGGLIGFLAGFVLPAVICTSRSDPTETVPCITGAFLLGGLPGFGIGLGIDAARTRKVTLFRSSGGAPTALTLVPSVAPGRIELRASVRLGKRSSLEQNQSTKF